MGNQEYLLGIDISTTGAKALLINTKGEVVSSSASLFSLSSPHPLWSEQNPQEWWSRTIISIRETLALSRISGKDVCAISLTGQMHGLVLLDAQNHVLRPAILWNDQRSGAECEEITSIVGFHRILEITGNKALAGFTAPKILWVRKNEPEVYSHIAHILLPKDYIRFCLTGEFATDKADGAGTLLFNLRNRNWSNEMLDLLQIPYEWMPKAFEGTEITGVISSGAAIKTGLKEGTPVIGGGGDQAAQAVGVGAIKPGIIALTLGTSGVIFTATSDPFIEPEGRLHAFCHSIPGVWHLMGVMLSAAGSLQWFQTILAQGTTFEELLAPAQEISPCSDGLLFLPYLTGERTPHPDPMARAAFIGLTMRHSKAHMTRALLEGVAFGLRDCMELVHQANPVKTEQVRISGGGSKSQIWRQIISDVMNTELVIVENTEGAAYGAALLAGVGLGIWSSAAECCNSVIRTAKVTQPSNQIVGRYEQAYQLYKSLYPILKPKFEEAAKLY